MWYVCNSLHEYTWITLLPWTLFGGLQASLDFQVPMGPDVQRPGSSALAEVRPPDLHRAGSQVALCYGSGLNA